MGFLVELVIGLVLGGLAMMMVAKLVSGFEIKGGFTDAMIVAGVYGLLKALLGKVLLILTLPLVILTIGVFIVVINAFILWITDKILERFTVKNTGALVIGTILLSVFDFLFQLVLRRGSIL